MLFFAKSYHFSQELGKQHFSFVCFERDSARLTALKQGSHCNIGLHYVAPPSRVHNSRIASL